MILPQSSQGKLKDYVLDKLLNKCSVSEISEEWGGDTVVRLRPNLISPTSSVSFNENDCLIKEIKKASEKLKENKVEPVDTYQGYSIFCTPYMYKKMKGLKIVQEARHSVLIRNILVNEKKRLITVVFQDGKHEIIKCSKEDAFDVKIGVALAIAQHLYGSKNKFHKEIAKKIKVLERKRK